MPFVDVAVAATGETMTVDALALPAMAQALNEAARTVIKILRMDIPFPLSDAGDVDDSTCPGAIVSGKPVAEL
jgi:hypothetical protein